MKFGELKIGARFMQGGIATYMKTETVTLAEPTGPEDRSGDVNCAIVDGLPEQIGHLCWCSRDRWVDLEIVKVL